MATWASIELCTDADILRFEGKWLEWSDQTPSWRAQAKDVIEQRLRFNLREKELSTSTADVLDLVGNTAALRHVACYKAIELACRSLMTNAQDLWSEKARYYGWKFDQDIANAIEMLSFDEDESGTIEDSEKYRLTGAVTFNRGAGIQDSTETDE